MNNQLIKTNKLITFEIIETASHLVNTINDLDQSAHRHQAIRRRKKGVYEIDVIANKKITTLFIKIEINGNSSKLLISIQLKKWTPAELRAIQSCFYQHLGYTVANRFIKFCSVQAVTEHIIVVVDHKFTHLMTNINGASHSLDEKELTKVIDSKSRKVFYIDSKISVRNKNLKIFNLKLSIRPTIDLVTSTQEKSKVVHEAMSIFFSSHTIVGHKEKSDSKTTLALKNPVDKKPDILEINFNSSMPFSWLAMIKLMPHYRENVIWR